MNMKKITLGFSLLAVAALFVVSCNKGTNTPPEQDMEFQSSKDVTYANSIATELEILVGYAAERWTHQNSAVFSPAPGSPTTQTIFVDLSDTLNKKISIIYTNSVTCRDGKKRNGTVVIDFSGSNTSYNAKYYRDAGFVAKVTLNNYWVDGWTVEDIQTFTVVNNVPNGYDPKQTDLNWTMSGYLHLQYLADTSKNMVWKGSLTKTMTNTEVASILPTKFTPINFVVYVAGTPTMAAQFAYSGTVTGVTSRVVSYTYTVDGSEPTNLLVRNLLCAPERILSVTQTSTGLIPVYSEWHPFISGVASFTSLGDGTTEPRRIDYGSGEPSVACDNAGTVTIKGVTYSIDFKK
ncbi:MAG: hypothetical protein K0S12_460 [Bacteroidetes bacterium]|nr:hypothetical protein [Bacteroidota bacterium]